MSVRGASARIAGFALLLYAALGLRVVYASDPFHLDRVTAGSPASPLLGNETSCHFGSLSSPVALEDAVERALCNNPDTRTAWAVIKQRAAAVGVSKAAYLPTLSAAGQWVHDDSMTDVLDHPALGSDVSTQVHSESLSLSWLLYDFNGRRASLENAKALLTAAQDSSASTLQQVFADVVKSYYAAQAKCELLIVDNAVLENAKEGLAAAQERVGHGAAPVTEVYQAETAFQQARLTLTRDRGELLAAEGTLASAMGLSPATSLELAGLNETVQPDAAFSESVATLIDRAEQSHPAILAAKSELQAAQSAITQAKAQGRPTIKLIGQYSRNNEPAQLGLGLPRYPAIGRDGYIGLQVNIPLFSGFGTAYQVRQAEAQAEQQAVALDDAKRKVALQVWTSYQSLDSDIDNLATSQSLQDVSTEALKSAQRRYRAGVGTILELLNTETAFAQAHQERVEAIATWRSDRLALAAALGNLGWNDVHGK